MKGLVLWSDWKESGRDIIQKSEDDGQMARGAAGTSGVLGTLRKPSGESKSIARISKLNEELFRHDKVESVKHTPTMMHSQDNRRR